LRFESRGSAGDSGALKTYGGSPDLAASTAVRERFQMNRRFSGRDDDLPAAFSFLEVNHDDLSAAFSSLEVGRGSYRADSG
jgi:hypothetical protein